MIKRQKQSERFRRRRKLIESVLYAIYIYISLLNPIYDERNIRLLGKKHDFAHTFLETTEGIIHQSSTKGLKKEGAEESVPGEMDPFPNQDQ